MKTLITEFDTLKPTSPTQLCKTPQINEFVKEIITKLKVINIDGETMEYILEQVGMEEQMFRQLVISRPEDDLYEIIDEKRALYVVKNK